nr:hypothetical protein [Mycobacterium tuberculosis]
MAVTAVRGRPVKSVGPAARPGCSATAGPAGLLRGAAGAAITAQAKE